MIRHTKVPKGTGGGDSTSGKGHSFLIMLDVIVRLSLVEKHNKAQTHVENTQLNIIDIDVFWSCRGSI